MTTNPFYRTERKQIYIPSSSGRLGGGAWIDEPDPFGRLLEPSGEARLDISDPFALSGPVGRRGGNAREDVGRIECLLKLAGVHDLAPTDGPTGYFGTRLEEAVKAFQKDHGLRTDGEINPGGETLKALARTLQGMGRHGDTVLAHLTPGEAQFLHEITDGGSINPMTGLVEFWFGFGGEDTDAGSYEGAVSAAAGDESLSDADFWDGYENATAAFDRANSGGGGGEGGNREGGHPGWGMAPSGPTSTPPAPPTTPDRTQDEETARRERLNTIEARRRERNKPNLLEETPRVTDNQTLEDDDQHLNFVDPLPGPTDEDETYDPNQADVGVKVEEQQRDVKIDRRITQLKQQLVADYRERQRVRELHQAKLRELHKAQKSAVDINNQMKPALAKTVVGLIGPFGKVGRALSTGKSLAEALGSLDSVDLPAIDMNDLMSLQEQSKKAVADFNRIKHERDLLEIQLNGFADEAKQTQQEIDRLKGRRSP